MTRVACLMMQKDEALLLRPWLLFVVKKQIFVLRMRDEER